MYVYMYVLLCIQHVHVTCLASRQGYQYTTSTTVPPSQIKAQNTSTVTQWIHYMYMYIRTYTSVGLHVHVQWNLDSSEIRIWTLAFVPIVVILYKTTPELRTPLQSEQLQCTCRWFPMVSIIIIEVPLYRNIATMYSDNTVHVHCIYL